MDYYQQILDRLNEMERQYNRLSTKGWFSMADAETYTRFCARQLKRYMDEGKLRSSRVGRSYRFRKSWLDALCMGFNKRLTPAQRRELAGIDR